MKQLVLNWVTGGTAMWVFSAAIRSLPDPAPMGNRFYLFLFKFLHVVGANFDKSDGAGK